MCVCVYLCCMCELESAVYQGKTAPSYPLPVTRYPLPIYPLPVAVSLSQSQLQSSGFRSGPKTRPGPRSLVLSVPFCFFLCANHAASLNLFTVWDAVVAAGCCWFFLFAFRFYICFRFSGPNSVQWLFISIHKNLWLSSLILFGIFYVFLSSRKA